MTPQIIVLSVIIWSGIFGIIAQTVDILVDRISGRRASFLSVFMLMFDLALTVGAMVYLLIAIRG